MKMRTRSKDDEQGWKWQENKWTDMKKRKTIVLRGYFVVIIS